MAFKMKGSSFKQTNTLDKVRLEDYLSKNRGQNNKFWEQSADTVAYHESGPHQRMQTDAAQDGGGPGRGMFQFESKYKEDSQDGFETAQNRYRNVGISTGLDLDKEIMNATSADQLSKDQQYSLFYANMIEGKADLTEYAKGNSSLEDIWIRGHKGIEKSGDRESFEESRVDAVTGLPKYKK